MQIEFNLHPLAIEDAHKAHQRSKIERFGNSLFIVVNTAQMLDGGIVYGESHLFLGTDFILTDPPLTLPYGSATPITGVIRVNGDSSVTSYCLIRR